MTDSGRIRMIILNTSSVARPYIYGKTDAAEVQQATHIKGPDIKDQLLVARPSRMVRPFTSPYGAAPKDVQELLGHSDVTTTMNIYAHDSKEAKRDAAKLLDKVR